VGAKLSLSPALQGRTVFTKYSSEAVEQEFTRASVKTTSLWRSLELSEPTGETCLDRTSSWLLVSVTQKLNGQVGFGMVE
jgi:hypothetical protein